MTENNGEQTFVNSETIFVTKSRITIFLFHSVYVILGWRIQVKKIITTEIFKMLLS